MEEAGSYRRHKRRTDVVFREAGRYTELVWRPRRAVYNHGLKMTLWVCSETRRQKVQWMVGNLVIE